MPPIAAPRLASLMMNFDEIAEFDQFPKNTSIQGRLSGRMEVAGNPWLEAWNNAKPVPSRRQKRLFDDTREAEKVWE